MDKHCTTRADALSVQQSLSLWRDIWAQPLGCHPSDNRFFGPPLHGHPPLGTCISRAQPVARLTRPTACTPQALQRWFGSGTPHGIANVSSSSLVLARRPSKRHALMRQAWQRRYKKRLRRSEGSKDIWTRPQNSPAWAVAIAPPRKHMGPPMPPGPLLQAKGQPSIEVQLAGHRHRPAPRLPMLGELDGAPG